MPADVLSHKSRPDLLVSGNNVVELKAASSLTPAPGAQLLNRLKAARRPVGYLVNSGLREKLAWKRFARTGNMSVN